MMSKALSLNLLIAIVTFGVYVRSLSNSFVSWDDPQFITENPLITEISPASLRALFDPKNYHALEIYTPLPLLTHQLEYFFFRLNPYYYHLTNLIFHMLNSLLVFWLVHSWCGKKGVAFLSGLLFGIHPLQVESVAWATERRDVLSSFFFFGSLLSYGAFRSKTRWKYYFASLGLFLLALFSKPMAVTLPLVLFLIDYKIRLPFKEKQILEKIPFLILSFVFSLITSSLQHPASGNPFSFWERSLLIIKAVAFHLRKIIFPSPLSAIYPLPRSVHFFSYEIFVPVLVVLLLLAGVYYSRKRTREIAFGFLYFLVTLTPALLLFYAPFIKVFATDHHMYLPSVGLIYLFSLGIHRLVGRHSPFHRLKNIAVFTSLLFLTVLFSIAAYRRTLVWRDSEVLALDVIKNYPDAAHAHSILGSLYAERGLIDQAMAENQKTLELDPHHPQALHILAVMCTFRGLTDEAEALYKQAITTGAGTMRTHYNLAMIYKQKSRLKEALSELEWALGLAPQEIRIYNQIGSIYARLGQLDKARTVFKKALEIDPNNPQTRDGLEKLAL